MFYCLKGNVVNINDKYIVINCNNFYFNILVSNPYGYKLNEDITIYTIFKLVLDEFTCFGFSTALERMVFTKLNLVQGIGPKTALTILKTVTAEQLIHFIKSRNLDALRKINGINGKASILVSELFHKLPNLNLNPAKYQNLQNILVSLGYEPNIVYFALQSIEDDLEEAEALKLAIQKIKNG